MKFEFSTASRIIFGHNSVKEIANLLPENARTAFVIAGRSSQQAQAVLSQLDDRKIKYRIFNVSQEPDIPTVKKAIDESRSINADLVLSIGGGSVMDTGKAAAAFLTNTGELEDYLEVIGKGLPIKNRAAFHIAIPTTAGTGAEVTSNSVIMSPVHKVKVSIRNYLMLPSIALVDPMLTVSMPPSVTASTGLDALTQLIEAFVSNKANPMTDSLCREGIKFAGRSLLRAFQNGSDIAAREDMSLASLLSGIVLSNAKLGAVHGFAGPLGGIIMAPHGVICARIVPFVFEANIETLKAAGMQSAIDRFDEISQILTANPNAKASDGIDWFKKIYEKLTLPKLTEFGLKDELLPAIVENAKKSSSMKGNPVELPEQMLLDILRKCCKS